MAARRGSAAGVVSSGTVAPDRTADVLLLREIATRVWRRPTPSRRGVARPRRCRSDSRTRTARPLSGLERPCRTRTTQRLNLAAGRHAEFLQRVVASCAPGGDRREGALHRAGCRGQCCASSSGGARAATAKARSISWWNKRTSASTLRTASAPGARRHSGPSVLLHARVASSWSRNGAVEPPDPFGRSPQTVQNRKSARCWSPGRGRGSRNRERRRRNRDRALRPARRSPNGAATLNDEGVVRQRIPVQPQQRASVTNPPRRTGVFSVTSMSTRRSRRL